LRLGIDVDGVLANFSKGYSELIIEQTGKNLFQEGDIENPPVWDWDLHRGYTKEEVSAAWKSITASPSFWAMLDPLPDAPEFLTWLWHSEHEVYFITNRMGVQPQFQTATFLHQFGYKLPSVVIATDKGQACAGLCIDVYLDDKAQNAMSVAQYGGAVSFLLKYRHNEFIHDDLYKEAGLTCDSLEQFKQWVIGYNNHNKGVH
jgi:hypothetical protein